VIIDSWTNVSREKDCHGLATDDDGHPFAAGFTKMKMQLVDIAGQEMQRTIKTKECPFNAERKIVEQMINTVPHECVNGAHCRNQFHTAGDP